MNHTIESNIVLQNQIDEQFRKIVTWIDKEGQNAEEAIGFIRRYFDHLNENTQKSMYEYLLDITKTRILSLDKQNELMLLLIELRKIKKNFTAKLSSVLYF